MALGAELRADGSGLLWTRPFSNILDILRSLKAKERGERVSAKVLIWVDYLKQKSNATWVKVERKRRPSASIVGPNGRAYMNRFSENFVGVERPNR